jgi:hypothetical protein
VFYLSDMSQGPKCLAQCDEYSKLNRMCLRESLLQLHPTLQKFITDGGQKWAKSYYDDLMSVKLDDIVEDSGKDPRLLDRYCTVLWALNPDGDYPEKFRVNVLEKVYGQVVTQRASTDAVREWLPRVIKSYVDAITEDNFAGVDPKLRDSLRKEFDDFCAAQGVSLDKSSKEAMAKSATNILHMNLQVSLASPGLRMIGTGIWRRSFETMKNQSILDSSLKNPTKWMKSAMVIKVRELNSFSVFSEKLTITIV